MVMVERYGIPPTRIISAVQGFKFPFRNVNGDDRIVIFTDDAMDPMVWQSAMIALREKGLDYERVLVPFTQATGYRPKHPVVVRANPKGQVPVLVDGDLTLFDSTVILEYLEDAYPAPPLYPCEPRARARCRLLELEADEIAFAPVRNLLYRTEPPLADAVAQARREDAGEAATAEIARHFASLDSRLQEGDWFCGAFSAASLALSVTYVLMHGPSRSPVVMHDSSEFAPRRLAP